MVKDMLRTGRPENAVPAKKKWKLAQKVEMLEYLDAVKASVLEEIHRIVPDDDARSDGLYEIMLDYPMRDGKALRPAQKLRPSSW